MVEEALAERTKKKGEVEVEKGGLKNWLKLEGEEENLKEPGYCCESFLVKQEQGFEDFVFHLNYEYYSICNLSTSFILNLPLSFESMILPSFDNVSLKLEMS